LSGRAVKPAIDLEDGDILDNAFHQFQCGGSQ
jgi:hypothetical protein